MLWRRFQMWRPFFNARIPFWATKTSASCLDGKKGSEISRWFLQSRCRAFWVLVFWFLTSYLKTKKWNSSCLIKKSSIGDSMSASYLIRIMMATQIHTTDKRHGFFGWFCWRFWFLLVSLRFVEKHPQKTWWSSRFQLWQRRKATHPCRPPVEEPWDFQHFAPKWHDPLHPDHRSAPKSFVLERRFTDDFGLWQPKVCKNSQKQLLRIITQTLTAGWCSTLTLLLLCLSFRKIISHCSFAHHWTQPKQ